MYTVRPHALLWTLYTHTGGQFELFVFLICDVKKGMLINYYIEHSNLF